MSEGPSEDRIIKLVCSDGKKFEVPMDVICRCQMIEKLQENLTLNGDKDEDTITLENVSGETFEKIIEYCEHHINEPIPTEEFDYKTSELSDWDAEFLKIDQNALYILHEAAKLLDNKALLDDCSKVIANKIKGKSIAQMRAILNIPNDLATDEVEGDVKQYKEDMWTIEPS